MALPRAGPGPEMSIARSPDLEASTREWKPKVISPLMSLYPKTSRCIFEMKSDRMRISVRFPQKANRSPSAHMANISRAMYLILQMSSGVMASSAADAMVTSGASKETAKSVRWLQRHAWTGDHSHPAPTKLWLCVSQWQSHLFPAVAMGQRVPPIHVPRKSRNPSFVKAMLPSHPSSSSSGPISHDPANMAPSGRTSSTISPDGSLVFLILRATKPSFQVMTLPRGRGLGAG
mmetsp:Transcript_57477/g.182021  ORF Transcript_57477/g.182021 Transcript_57477/m.182021 type:complete len:233 (-) Transcript_57477:2377-3075(-)